MSKILAVACSLILAGTGAARPSLAQGSKQPDPDNQVRRDAAGDALPKGALARLGVTRFRHAGWRSGMTIAPDSKTLVTTAEEGQSVRFWDIATGKLLHEIREADRRHPAVAFSPDGKWFATVGVNLVKGRAESSSLIFWDAKTREAKRTFKLSEPPDRLLFTPDGKFMLGNVLGQVVVLEAETGKEFLRYRLFERRGVGAMALSHDGRLVAICSDYPAEAKVWDWQSPEEPRSFRIEHGRGCTTLAFSPNDKMLFGRQDGDEGVLIWEVASGKLRKEWTGHRSLDYAGTLAPHPDGKRIAVTQAGNRVDDEQTGGVFVWNLQTGKLEKTFWTPGDRIQACLFSADGRWLAARSDRGAHVWDLDSGREVAAYKEAHDGLTWRMAISPKGVLATNSEDRSIGLWDADNKCLNKLGQAQSPSPLAFSADDSLLLSAGPNNTVDLWDVSSGKKRYSLPGHGRYGGVRALAFAPDCSRFYSFGADLYFRAYRTANAKTMVDKQLIPKGMDPKILKDGDNPQRPLQEYLIWSLNGAEFTRDCKKLVLAKHLGVHIFDTATGDEIGNFETDHDLWTFHVSPDGRWLLAGGSQRVTLKDVNAGRTEVKNFLTIWELATGKIVRRVELAHYARCVAFSPDGKYYALARHYGEPGPHVRIWESKSGKEVHTIKELPGSVQAVVFSPDNRRLYTSMDDTTVLVWPLPLR